MEAVLATLEAFVKNQMFWPPEQFQDIQDETVRKCVRAAFREPSHYIPKLLQTGTQETLEEFSKAVKDRCPLMYLATFAGFLEMLYAQECQDHPYSRELVPWFRKNGWTFPKFKFEEEPALLPPSEPQTPHPSPRLQPLVKVEKIDEDE